LVTDDPGDGLDDVVDVFGLVICCMLCFHMTDYLVGYDGYLVWFIYNKWVLGYVNKRLYIAGAVVIIIIINTGL
jgi:hypothetical protein